MGIIGMTKIVRLNTKLGRLEIDILSNKTKPVKESKIMMSFLLISLVTVVSFMSTAPSVNGAGLPFSNPQGVAVDDYGLNKYVYVVDSGNNRIQKFILANPCPAGTTQIDTGVCFVTTWGSYGQGNDQFDRPSHVAVDKAGDDVYVVDSGNNRIQKFTADGIFITTWGSGGNATGSFNNPRGIATDYSGNVYVADSGNERIQKFTLANPCPAETYQVVTGVCFVNLWGSHGSGDVQFDRPTDVAVDNAGDVLVLDKWNFGLKKFKLTDPCPAGTTQVVTGVCFVLDFGGSVAGGVAPDYSGNVFVTNERWNSVTKYKLGAFPCPSGTLQTVYGLPACLVTDWGTKGSLGTKGSSHGQFLSPGAVAVDAWGNVYVADRGNNRIEKFTNTGTYLLTIKPTFVKTYTPKVTVSQQCLYKQQIYSQLSIQTGRFGPYINSFSFDPSTQDMAIIFKPLGSTSMVLSYGSAVGTIYTTKYSPWYGFGGPHEVLVFVEKKGDPLHNNRLDPGELSATTTFNTKIC